MTIDIVSKKPPYYSSILNENYINVLFKPKHDVQSRELNEAQLIAKNQTKKFAEHIFSNGSRVQGGVSNIKRVRYFNIDKDYLGTELILNEWIGQNIEVYENDTFGVAVENIEVIAVAENPTENYYTLYTNSIVDEFSNSHLFRITDTSVAASIVQNSEYTGLNIYIQLDAGIFYINGNFVDVEAQAIVARPGSTEFPTGYFGFNYDEIVITAADNPDLKDPARGETSFSAVGADRLQASAKIAFYLDPEDEIPSNFVSLTKIVNGLAVTSERPAIYSELALEFERRTFDESGDYTVRPYQVNANDHIPINVISIEASAPTANTKARVTTSYIHSLNVGDTIEISGAVNDVNNHFTGEFTVETIVDENVFTYDAGSVVLLDAEGTLALKKPNYMTIEVGPGKSYVRGREHETLVSQHIDVLKSRTYETAENHNITAFYGSYVSITNLTGGIPDFTDFPTVTFTAPSLTIATARAKQAVKTATGWNIYVFDVEVLPNRNFADVNRITFDATGATGVIANPELTNSEFDSFIYPVNNRVIRTLQPNNVPATTYQYYKSFSATSDGAGSVSINITADDYFTGPREVDFYNSQSFITNYYIFDESSNAEVSPTFAEITASGQQLTLTMPSPGTYTIFATITRTNASFKTKTLTTQSTQYAYDPAVGIIDLEVPDVVEIVSIISLETVASGNNDATSIFTLDTGQRDDFYDHASVKAKPGQAYNIPAGNVQIDYRYYAHGNGDFFSIDSYTGLDRTDIPSYNSKLNGNVNLGDMIDFRPVRNANSNAFAGENVPKVNSIINSDYDYYLSRKDILVINRQGNLIVITGEPALIPEFPEVPDSSMKMYEFTVPAFTSDAADDVGIRFIQNKRYTMRDIGRIDKRVERNTYYTSLSLLEMRTENVPVIDNDGLERSKSGFLVDDFSGHKIGDPNSPDYSCSIDTVKQELRPGFISDRFKTSLNNSATTMTIVGNETIGDYAILPYEEFIFQQNLIASKSINVQPYFVIKITGVMQTNPMSDDWMDTERAPSVSVDLAGNLDAWNSINGGFGTEWNDWQTTWTGVTTDVDVDVRRLGRGSSTTTTTTTTTTTDQIRTGTERVLSFEAVEKSLGDRVIDTRLAYYMRELNIEISGFQLQPNADLHAFIDDTKMNNSITPAPGYEPSGQGSVRTDDNGFFKCSMLVPGGTFRTGERQIMFSDEANNVSENAKTETRYVFNSSGLINTVQEVSVSVAEPTVNSVAITQERELIDTETDVNVEIRIPPTPPQTIGAGPGGGGCCFDEKALVTIADGTLIKISDIKIGEKVYNGNGGSNTVLGIESPVLANRSMISINGGWAFFSEEHPMLTTDGWACANPDCDEAKMHLVDGEIVTLKLEVGMTMVKEDGVEELITSIDFIEDDYNKIIYNLMLDGDHQYVVEGYIVHNKGGDPVAQTFYVDPNVYKAGTFATSVGVYFKTKDTSVPVRVEIRPVVNGFPSATTVLPFGTAYLNPDDVNIPADTDNMDDIKNNETKFTFPVPVYLEPGKEYSFIVISNSLDYEIFVSEMGQFIIGTDITITSQPVLGSLFKSQNQRTWTPFQNEDIMHNLYMADFETQTERILSLNAVHGTEQFNFNHTMLSTNAISNEPFNKINWSAQSKLESTSTLSTPYPIIANENLLHPNERILAASGDMPIVATASTVNKYTSPLINIARTSVTLIKNNVNDYGLKEDDFNIVDSGSGYSAPPTITAESPNGVDYSGIGILNNSGQLIGVQTLEEGSGFIDSANIVVSGNANITYDAFENRTQGGNANARYFTKPVVLSETYATDYIQVYADVNVPAQADIQLYMRAKSSTDPRDISNVEWVPMQRRSDRPLVNEDPLQFVENLWEPQDGTLAYSYNGVNHNKIIEYQTKIVMLAGNSSYVPRIKDMRIISAVL